MCVVWCSNHSEYRVTQHRVGVFRWMRREANICSHQTTDAPCVPQHRAKGSTQFAGQTAQYTRNERLVGRRLSRRKQIKLNIRYFVRRRRLFRYTSASFCIVLFNKNRPVLSSHPTRVCTSVATSTKGLTPSNCRILHRSVTQ